MFPQGNGIQRVALIAFAAAVGLIGIALVTTRRSANAGTITVFVTGDTRGYLEPCGCRRDQAGGLPGRMTLVKQDSTPDRLVVDVGNLTSGGRSYELLKLKYLLRGMRRIGYDAVNIGRRDAGLDRDTLSRLIAESDEPFVSCNILNRDTAAPIAEPYRIRSVGGLTVAITGVAEAPDDEVGPGLRIRPAAEALADLLPSLKARCDCIVVLAFVNPDALRAIADRFHEIDCLLGGDVPQSSEKAENLNRAVGFNVTDKGKVLGELRFQRNGDRLDLIDSRAVKVKDTISPAPEIAPILQAYKDSLRERNIEFASEEGLDPIARATTTADLYVGRQACAACHADAHRAELASAHAIAYQSLVTKRSEFDPECLHCHTVGYGSRDGFTNVQRTPGLAGVQCESCHGRGGEHVKAMQASIHQASTFRAVTPNSCVRCHDKENSENFDYATYWPKIKHG